jgi:hypothetical protein
MPWRCPACQIQIRHNEHEDKPRAGRHYRCHVCRLELVLNERTGRLDVVPMRVDEPEEKSRPTR